MADSELQKAINKLVEQKPGSKKELGTLQSAQPIGPAKGTGKGAASSTGGATALASPVTEGLYSTRTFHPTLSLLSSDGLFTIQLKPVKNIVMLDANSNPITFVYATPP